MSWMNKVPILSQVKMFAHLIDGDTEEAARTSEDFLTKCPVVSHVVGTTLAVAGAVTRNQEFQDFAIRALEGGTETLFDIVTFPVRTLTDVFKLLANDITEQQRCTLQTLIRSTNLEKRRHAQTKLLTLLEESRSSKFRELEEKKRQSVNASDEDAGQQVLRILEEQQRKLDDKFNEAKRYVNNL